MALLEEILHHLEVKAPYKSWDKQCCFLLWSHFCSLELAPYFWFPGIPWLFKLHPPLLICWVYPRPTSHIIVYNYIMILAMVCSFLVMIIVPRINLHYPLCWPDWDVNCSTPFARSLAPPTCSRDVWGLGDLSVPLSAWWSGSVWKGILTNSPSFKLAIDFQWFSVHPDLHRWCFQTIFCTVHGHPFLQEFFYGDLGLRGGLWFW